MAGPTARALLRALFGEPTMALAAVALGVVVLLAAVLVREDESARERDAREHTSMSAAECRGRLQESRRQVDACRCACACASPASAADGGR